MEQFVVATVIQNPDFVEATKNIFNKFGLVAGDLSESLHQINNFLRRKKEFEIGYKFASNKDFVFEEFCIETKDKSELKVKLKQLSDTSLKFNGYSRLDIGRVHGAYSTFASHCDDEEMVMLAKYFDVFVRTIASGFFYGNIEYSGSHLKLEIGKYNYDNKPVMVVITMKSDSYTD